MEREGILDRIQESTEGKKVTRLSLKGKERIRVGSEKVLDRIKEEGKKVTSLSLKEKERIRVGSEKALDRLKESTEGRK